jgi:two-component system NtrC family sensor kinase
MVQVLLNLVLNAVDATGKDGHISLVAQSDGDALEITVTDNGPGIAPEHAPRLFEPYFTTKRNGTGLGLFVSRKLVADHGGTLDFASSPGEGAAFRIRVPLPARLPATEPPRLGLAPLLPAAPGP